MFHEILNRARFGKITETDVKYIKSNCLKKVPDITEQSLVIKPTMLLCKRDEADRVNNTELKKIKNAQIYEYKKNVIWLENTDKKVLNALSHIPDSVSLCVGAQVMLTVNLNVEQKLVNGSRGIIVDFCELYDERLPVVQFVDKKVTVELYKYTIGNIKNVSIVKVLQIPLQLAYALTIHKSMGSTLDCAHIDFQGVFEYGQAYVALSRIKSLKNLYVKNITAFSFKAHPEAVHFYDMCKNITAS
jgi:ATP-dependent DNA helicase PIF1